MVQIDMPMPEKCSDCIFCDDNCSCDASDYDGFGINVGCAYRTGRRDIRCPLKEQEAKTGHWIDSAGNDKCSNCGTEYSDLYPDYGNTHFCPNCGAKMEGR